MAEEFLPYDKMVEAALRGVVREALSRVARDGLRGDHHFYIGFATRAPEVRIPAFLLQRYQEEMTIVLQHQFWDLQVGDTGFSVTLSFQNRPERLTIPFAAIRAFTDPSVKFGLQFEVPAAPEGGIASLPAPAPALVPADSAEETAAKPSGEVVALDKFRKR